MSPNSPNALRRGFGAALPLSVPVGICGHGFAALLVVLILPAPAWAYIDPGTGSIAYQVLLAGLLAVGFAVRRAWGRISASLKFRRAPGRSSDEPPRTE